MRQHRAKRVAEHSSNLAACVQGRLRYLQTAFQGTATFAETPLQQVKTGAIVSIKPGDESGDYLCSCITQTPNDVALMLKHAQECGTPGFIQINPDARASVDLLSQVWAQLTRDQLVFDLNALQAWGASSLTVSQANGWLKSLAIDHLLSRWELPAVIKDNLLQQLAVLNKVVSEGSLSLSSDGIMLQYCITGTKPDVFNLTSIIHQFGRATWPILLVAEEAHSHQIQLAGCIPLRWLHKFAVTPKLQAFFWLKELAPKQKMPVQKAS